MIKRFYVDNFRCLANFEFKPDQVNLLVGANGAGKSTFFEALQTIRELAAGSAVSTLFYPGLLPWWDRRLIHTFELDYSPPGSEGLFHYGLRVRHPEGQGQPFIDEESLTVGERPLFSVSKGRVKLHRDDPAHPLELPYNGSHAFLSSGLGETHHVREFKSSLLDSGIFKINPWAIDQNSAFEERGLQPNGSNFASWLRGRALEDPAAFTRFQEILAHALPRFRSIRFRDTGGGSKLLLGVVNRPGPLEQTIPFADFSEGEKCLCVLGAVAASRHLAAVVALDEPDNFLSIIEVQQVLRNLIEPHQTGRCQIFVISHHPEAIDYLAPDSTWLFDRPGSEHTRLRLLTFERAQGERASESIKTILQ